MRTFAEKPKTTQQTASAKSPPGRDHMSHSLEANTALPARHTLGSQAVSPLHEARSEKVERDDSHTAELAPVGPEVEPSAWNFSKIRVQADRGFGSEPGVPLPSAFRSTLENYFHTPLDRVTVHTDSESQAAADRLDAAAFTLGQDIHLGPVGVRAGGAAKAALLAHEVVHTLQQGPVVARAKPTVGTPGDAFERQADQLATGFVRFTQNPQRPYGK